MIHISYIRNAICIKIVTSAIRWYLDFTIWSLLWWCCNTIIKIITLNRTFLEMPTLLHSDSVRNVLNYFCPALSEQEVGDESVNHHHHLQCTFLLVHLQLFVFYVKVRFFFLNFNQIVKVLTTSLIYNWANF